MGDIEYALRLNNSFKTLVYIQNKGFVVLGHILDNLK